MHVSVTFEPSHGQLAMVIYEWNDVKYLGKITSASDDTLPVSETVLPIWFGAMHSTLF